MKKIYKVFTKGNSIKQGVILLKKMNKNSQ